MSAIGQTALIADKLIEARQLRFLSDDNFYEYSQIILDPEYVGSEVAHTGNPASVAAHEKFKQRSEQLSKWVENGHTLVLIVRSPRPFRFKVGVNQVSTASIHSLRALQPLVFANATGAQIDVTGATSTDMLFSKFIGRMRYEATVSGAGLMSMLRVKTTSAAQTQLVGAYRKFGKGKIVLVPICAGTSEQNNDYFSMLTELPALLVESKNNELPEWVDLYMTQNEKVSVAGIKRIRKEIQFLEQQIADEQKCVEDTRELKALFSGTGHQLQQAAASALREFGLTVVEGPIGRADLLATDGKRLIAVEVKGLDGSAKESDFRQVERWKAEANLVLSNHDDTLVKDDPDLANYRRQINELSLPADAIGDSKGLLIVGTYRSLPLLERSELDYPDGVVRRLEQNDVCGLTGLQLFSLVMVARENPAEKHAIIEALLRTAGVMKGVPAWDQYVSSSNE